MKSQTESGERTQNRDEAARSDGKREAGPSLGLLRLRPTTTSPRLLLGIDSPGSFLPGKSLLVRASRFEVAEELGSAFAKVLMGEA
jgi:hypothetical protein